MSEKLMATDLWVLQAQETIKNQQATIDRVTDQRDRLVARFKGKEWKGHVTDALIAEIEAGK